MSVDHVIAALVVAAGLGPLLTMGQLTPARMLSVLLMAVLLSRFGRRVDLWKMLPTVFGFVYAFAWIAGARTLTLESCLQPALYVAYGLLATGVAALPYEPRLAKLVTGAMAFVGFLVALTTIAQRHYGIGFGVELPVFVQGGVQRVAGIYDDPNATGGVTACGIIALLSNVACQPRIRLRLKLAVLTVLPVLAYGLYLTASRTALAALLAGMASILFFSRKKIAVFILLLAALLAVVSNIETILQGRELSLSADYSAQQRKYHAVESLRRLEKDMLIGSGAIDSPYFAHNNVLEVLALGGILSFIPFLLVHVAIFRRVPHAMHRPDLQMLLNMFVVLSCVGMGVTWLNSVLYWLLIGLLLEDFDLIEGESA